MCLTVHRLHVGKQQLTQSDAWRRLNSNLTPADPIIDHIPCIELQPCHYQQIIHFALKLLHSHAGHTKFSFAAQSLGLHDFLFRWVEWYGSSEEDIKPHVTMARGKRNGWGEVGALSRWTISRSATVLECGSCGGVIKVSSVSREEMFLTRVTNELSRNADCVHNLKPVPIFAIDSCYMGENLHKGQGDHQH